MARAGTCSSRQGSSILWKRQRWTVFAPYWQRIRWSSYARSALLAAERFYGVEDINDQTHQILSEAIQAANTTGLYERVLSDAGTRTGCARRAPEAGRWFA